MNHLTCKIYWDYSTTDETFETELWNRWEKKQKSILSDSVHPVRLKLSVLARMSFEKLKTLHGEVFNPSYAHTDDLGLCSVTENLNEFSGIDIERTDRVIPKESYKMFINDEDADLPPLQLWCIKEAAFKALSNSFNRTEPKLLKEITIDSNESFHYKKCEGSFLIEKKEIKGIDYLIAQAVIKKGSS